MDVKHKINLKYQSLELYILDIHTHFNRSNNTIKEGRNHLKIVKLDGKNYVVKSFQKPSSIKSYTYGNLTKSKARRSFEYANTLLSKDIHTPTPVAFIEYYNGIKFCESFYVCEHHDYDYNLSVLLPERGEGDASFNDSDALWTSFMNFTVDLHEKGIYHLDFTRKNILITTQGNMYHFSIVDLNRMKFKPLSFKERIASLGKMTSDKNLIELIAKHYSIASQTDEAQCLQLLQKSVAKHQQYWDRKRSLKKILK